MKNVEIVIRSYLPILYVFLLIPFVSFSQTITFDDSDPQIMVLNNGSSYEIAFYKLTGALVYIKDIPAGVELSHGVTYDDLWWMDFTNGSHMKSSNYNHGEPHDFSYLWVDSLKILSLLYTPDSLADIQVNATVSISVYDTNYFDMQIHVENKGDGIINNVLFPSNMNLSLNQGDGVYFPITYPGTMYGSDLFESKETAEYECDFMSLQIGEGNMAVYQLYNDTCIQTVAMGIHDQSGLEIEENYLGSVRYYTWTTEGESWTSQVSRFRIGQTPLEAIQGFREDNAIDDYPSVEEKLGNQFSTYSRSPIYAYGFPHFDPPGYYYWDVQDQLKYYPGPAILIFNNYSSSACPVCPPLMPDYFPPEPMLGTLEDFQQMISDLKSEGFLIMLATHPNFWHADSPTVTNLPEGISIEDIAVLDWNGNVKVMDHFGEMYIYISLTSPFVQQKFDENYHHFFETYGADMIYEDAAVNFQIYNFNENEISPLHNRQEWIKYFEERSSYPSIPEGSIIPMSKSVVGNIGTSYKGFEQGDREWNYITDDGYRRPYPLVSSLYRDKVIPYPSAGTFTEDKDVFAWNTLFGCPYYVDLDEMTDSPYWNINNHGDWIPVIHEFQVRVMARFIGKQLIDYLDLEGAATQADYGEIITIRNWDANDPYNYDSHSIVPQGVYVRSKSGDLEAGILSRYNGAALSPGDHYLIVETFSDSIELRHPMGDSTTIEIRNPESWTDEDEIHIYSITKDSIKEMIPIIESDIIQFQLKKAVADTTRIEKYLILYGDTLQVTKDPEPGVAINDNTIFSDLICYPNPYTHQTRIVFNLDNPGKVYLRIYDPAGKAIRVLLEDHLETGEYNVVWEGKNDQGLSVSSGLYILDCILGDQRIFKKILKL